MWIVWDKEDGLVCIGDYVFCLEAYKKHKKYAENYLYNNDELSEEDIGYQVIMAKAEECIGLFENPEGLYSLEELSGTDSIEGWKG
ncbi:hypothetical protein [Carnobacterium mobile]|uniref:hypothetical protein n=1 Tax=Carnobacterium mobile TaxID=2750 RepID=UPI000558AD6D|nr:hypothetical protein [Carnobacterium mobile]